MENSIKIGEKIKKLRKQSCMTQEKLADYLGVSFQAISKWECGAASPDISLLVPLSRLFGVSIDELLDNLPPQASERYGLLKKKTDEAWQLKNMREYYSVSQKAVEEYPGDLYFLYCLALAELNYAGVYEKEIAPEEQRTLFEDCAKHAAEVIENTKDEKMKFSAIKTAVLALCTLGRKKEARLFAEMSGEEEFIVKCLEGDEKTVRKQALIICKLESLVRNLSFPNNDIGALDAVDKIIKSVFPDGNYLYFCSSLMHNEMWRAAHFASVGNFAEALSLLKSSYGYACAWDKMLQEGKRIKYTAAIFDRLEFNPNSVVPISLCEAFCEYLNLKSFDSMRETEEFQNLYGGMKA